MIFKILVTVFFKSKILIRFIFVSSISLLILSILIFVSRMFAIAHLSIFIIAALKFLSDNSKIYGRGLLMSMVCPSPNELRFSWFFHCHVILVYFLDILSFMLRDFVSCLYPNGECCHP